MIALITKTLGIDVDRFAEDEKAFIKDEKTMIVITETFAVIEDKSAENEKTFIRGEKTFIVTTTTFAMSDNRSAKGGEAFIKDEEMFIVITETYAVAGFTHQPWIARFGNVQQRKNFADVNNRDVFFSLISAAQFFMSKFLQLQNIIAHSFKMLIIVFFEFYLHSFSERLNCERNNDEQFV